MRRSCSATPTTSCCKPGAQAIADAGGLHRLMRWPRSILTDSGGYQVFSLRHTLKLDDDGAVFQSVYDGSHGAVHARERRRGAGAARLGHRDGARRVPARRCRPRPAVEAAVARTTRVGEPRPARRTCGRAARGGGRAIGWSLTGQPQLQFGIVQGGVHDGPARAQRARAARHRLRRLRGGRAQRGGGRRADDAGARDDHRARCPRTARATTWGSAIRSASST